MREDVSIWKAGGMSDESIARVLRIDADTMKKHFADELATHWAQKVARVISARYTAAIKGNVSAQTKFLEAARAVGAEHTLSQPAPAERKQRVMPVGKKEAADEAARTAGLGTEWGEDLQLKQTIQ
jgi:hypothetical protein